MSSSCLALLLSLVSTCTLPWSPLSIHVSIPPHPELCVQYAEQTPLCLTALIAQLESRHLL